MGSDRLPATCRSGSRLMHAYSVEMIPLANRAEHYFFVFLLLTFGSSQPSFLLISTWL